MGGERFPEVFLKAYRDQIIHDLTSIQHPIIRNILLNQTFCKKGVIRVSDAIIVFRIMMYVPKYNLGTSNLIIMSNKITHKGMHIIVQIQVKYWSHGYCTTTIMDFMMGISW